MARKKSRSRRSRTAAVRARAAALPWAKLPDAKLLDVRLCDLNLRLQGTRIADRILRLYVELARRSLRIRPRFWLSDGWFTPDGECSIAVPFYLAHPRLMELERRQMLDVEGGTERACMKILRHEAGHAIDNAYRLYRRADYKRVFGRPRKYPEHYRPRPYSKRFVLHLDAWYAQSHPAEDFAETFALWLTPGFNWRKQYAGWPALRKLHYVDRLMNEIAATRPRVRSKRQWHPLRELTTTLREHYARKKARYASDYPSFYDRDLQRLFSNEEKGRRRVSAARFLRTAQPDLRQLVARWTGEHPYTIDQVLREMVARCRALRLRLNRPERQTMQEAAVLLTVQTMNYLQRGRRRVWL
jgi:hypothetical protein